VSGTKYHLCLGPLKQNCESRRWPFLRPKWRQAL
jgi:hypothetical protein